jgi:transposase-like protein
MQSILSRPEFQNEEAAFAYVEAKLWPGGPVCPKCSVIGKARRLQGKSSRPGLWKCYACRKQFTVRVGTVFESSHAPMHIWLQVMYIACSNKKGFPTRQVQRMLNCSMKTAWFMGHRIREAMKELPASFSEPMGGAGAIIEQDETFVGGKAENRAFEPSPPKAPIVSLVQRGGGVRSFHVPYVNIQTLRPIIAKHAHADSRYMTDSNRVAGNLGTWFASHETVNHSAKEYVRDDVYTNSVEGYFTSLKRGICGVYFHVSETHLHRYLAEFDFRYSHRAKLGVDDVQRTDLAIKGAAGKRLTYQTTRKQPQGYAPIGRAQLEAWE